MEIDVRQIVKQRTKRRQRAQRMQADRDSKVDDVDGDVVGCAEDSADEDKKPLVSRPPQRRKKAQQQLFKEEPSPILEEDVVDGFAILSFKTFEDMEVSRRFIYGL